jgi:hypothetical protein
MRGSVGMKNGRIVQKDIWPKGLSFSLMAKPEKVHEKPTNAAVKAEARNITAEFLHHYVSDFR